MAFLLGDILTGLLGHSLTDGNYLLAALLLRNILANILRMMLALLLRLLLALLPVVGGLADLLVGGGALESSRQNHQQVSRILPSPCTQCGTSRCRGSGTPPSRRRDSPGCPWCDTSSRTRSATFRYHPPPPCLHLPCNASPWCPYRPKGEVFKHFLRDDPSLVTRIDFKGGNV